MIFKAERGPLTHKGQVVYIQQDWAFDFEPPQIGEAFTVLIHDLSISFMFIATSLACGIQVWGFHPNVKWIKKILQAPEAFTGKLLVVDENMEDFISVPLEASKTWKTYYDMLSGWVCIGEDITDEHDVAVEFATNTIAVIRNEQLKALWLKPLIKETA